MPAMVARLVVLAFALGLQPLQVSSARSKKLVDNVYSAEHQDGIDISDAPWLTLGKAKKSMLERTLWHSGSHNKQIRGLPGFVQATVEHPARLYGYTVGAVVEPSSLDGFGLWIGDMDGVVAVGHSRMGVVAALAFQFLETQFVGTEFNHDHALQQLEQKVATITSPDGTSVEKSIAGDARSIFASLGVDVDHSQDYVMALNGFLLGYAKTREEVKGVMTSFVIKDVCTSGAIAKAEASASKKAVKKLLSSS